MAAKIKEIYQMPRQLNMGNMTVVIVLLKNCPAQGDEYKTAHHLSCFSKTMMLLTMRPDETFNDPENNKINVCKVCSANWRWAMWQQIQAYYYRAVQYSMTCVHFATRLEQHYRSPIVLRKTVMLSTMRQDVCAHCWSGLGCWTTLYLHTLSHFLRSRFLVDL